MIALLCFNFFGFNVSKAVNCIPDERNMFACYNVLDLKNCGFLKNAIVTFSCDFKAAIIETFSRSLFAFIME